MNKTNVLFHADDYGYTLETSKGILDCIKQGKLDSFSVIANTSYFEESKKLFLEEIPNLPFLPRIAVHINLVEGYSDNSDAKIIAKDGTLVMSWGKILLTSFTSKRRQLKRELKEDIKAQIEKVNEFVEECMKVASKNNIPYFQKGIRLDSHTHTHPIPIVWEAITELVEEEKYNIEYIRNPKEPITPFFNKYLKTYRPINFVKNAILNIFSHKIDKYCLNKKLPLMYMWGLVMSGKMDLERTKYIYPKMLAKTKNNNRDLEILAHPGKADKNEIRKEFSKINMEEFNLRDDRDVEKNMILNRLEVVSNQQ